MTQATFAATGGAVKTKTTRRGQFLAEMNAVIPWQRFIQLIEPHYPRGEKGRPSYPMEPLLRIYLMQQWFNLSDPDGRRQAPPDESTILRFRHPLEGHKLTEAIFAEVRTLLKRKGLLVKSGTIVDATIIAAPPSTKNAAGRRDPGMKQTRKGKQ